MRARVIIYNPKLDSILLIHRKKNGRDYWVIPGGGAKNQETPTQTAIREIKEELDLDFVPQELSSIFEIAEEDEVQKVFFAETHIIKAPTINGEELNRSNKNNIYLPTWVKLNAIAKINLLPLEGKRKLQNYLYRLGKLNLNKIVISIEGKNNIGKTVFINNLIERNPIIRSMQLGETNRLKDANWWFSYSSPYELCDELLNLIKKRNEKINKINSPIILLDKGTNTIWSRIASTLAIRGIDNKKIEEYHTYFIKRLDELNLYKEVSILFISRISNENNSDQNYKKYNIESDYILKNLKNNYTVSYAKYPDAQTYHQVEQIITNNFEKLARDICNNIITTRFYGISGFSESGKSYFSKYSDVNYNIWNLKIINFINEAKLLVNPKCRSLIEITATYLLIKFAASHYFKDSFIIESVYSEHVNSIFKNILGENYQLIFLNADKRVRLERSEDKYDSFIIKERKKTKLKVGDLYSSANYLINNSHSIINTKMQLDKIYTRFNIRKITCCHVSEFRVKTTVKEIINRIFEYSKVNLKDLLLFSVTGSVYSGTFIENWSDIDILIIVSTLHKNEKALKAIYKMANKFPIKIGISLYAQQDILEDKVDMKTITNLFFMEQGYIQPLYIQENIKLPFVEFEKMISRQKAIRNLYLFDIRRNSFSPTIKSLRKVTKECFTVLNIDSLINNKMSFTYNDIQKNVKKYNPALAKKLKVFINKIPNIKCEDVQELCMWVINANGIM